MLVSSKQNEVYVSLWGAKKVLVFDKNMLAQKAEIAVGDQPNEMILNKKQDLSLVANSHDNSVSVIDLPSRKTPGSAQLRPLPRLAQRLHDQ